MVIQESLAKEEKGSWSAIFRKGIRVALFAGMGLAILSQFTGINAIIYYGPRIMEEAGIQLSDALGGQVVIGFVNVLATVVAILRIDKFGRKRLMFWGVTGMFFSLIAVGILFLTGQIQGILLLVFILTFLTTLILAKVLITPENIRSLLAHESAKHLGSEIRAERVHIKYLKGIRLENVTIEPVKGKEEDLFSCSEIEVKYGLFPLLTKRLLVKELSIKDPEFTLELINGKIT